MRLICPNCGAQYEVDDAVIPVAGRDVQCSNCGHTWFQRPAHLDGELADELDDDAPPPPAATEEERKPRGLDPSVASVLREEAQREAAARRAEAEGLEVQPDLGLDDAEAVAEDRSAAARARMARLRGLEDLPDTLEAEPDNDAETALAELEAAAREGRGEALPDVEEITSSLRSSEDRAPDDETETSGAPQQLAEERRERGGFRRGFFLVILLLLAAILIYVYAGQIGEAVPEAAPYLDAYTDWARGVLGAINELVDSVVALVQSMISGAES